MSRAPAPELARPFAILRSATRVTADPNRFLHRRRILIAGVGIEWLRLSAGRFPHGDVIARKLPL
jgi:hypothetical protein